MKKTFFAMLLSSGLILAQEIKVGTYLPFEYCKDQFDQSVIIDKKSKLLIVTFSKEKGIVMKNFLQKNKDFLRKKRATYMSDVSDVPTFVMAMFMKPKFKSYNYQIGLIEDEKDALLMPKKEGLITVIHLRNKKIRKIEYKENLDYLIKK
ncbi:MAG: hypothetical protein U9N30_09695 [Campylobacterota bacterium]|nr:hypothetical protein [Campylobacterota bacterium]